MMGSSQSGAGLEFGREMVIPDSRTGTGHGGSPQARLPAGTGGQ